MRGEMVFLVALAYLLICFSCTRPSSISSNENPEALSKITFDQEELREDGLYGPPDGLRALSYEFCIPMEKTFVNQVKAIDTTVRIYQDSPGRIGCSKGEFLCIGSSHQKNFRRVLIQLANLDYIKRIDQSFFE